MFTYLPRSLEFVVIMLWRNKVHTQKVTPAFKSFLIWEAGNHIRFDGQIAWIKK